jgi:carboxypeptidase Taq
MDASAQYQRLKQRLGEVHDLHAAAALLGWDQETYMPIGAAEGRAEQLATISRLAHEIFTSRETGDLLAGAAEEVAGLDPDSDEARLVVVAQRDYDKARRLPDAFVAEVARATSYATSVWREAHPTHDFDRFKPHLAQVMELHLQLADYLGYQEHPYDALLDSYEPEVRTSQIRQLFDALRDGIVPLAKAIAEQAERVSAKPLYGTFDERDQLAFAQDVIRQIGFDFDRGRQDLSAHPFCQSIGANDARITTRVSPTFISTALFGTIHEMGHALYEIGTAPALARTSLAGGASLGIHESQSRLWENVVGRSRPFWRYFYPQLQQRFPQHFGAVSLDDFYGAINVSGPSFIRVEADEVTYNLHIMLRFDLEVALLEKQLKVDDLPDAWNELTQRYLGLTPPHSAAGVMQDIHWPSGLIGYFPTYTMGNVLSVQLYEAAVAAHPEIPAEIERGQFGTLLEWMRVNIHQHGRKFLPNELIERATGRALDPEPYIRYLHTKYREVYRLTPVHA